MVEVFHANGLSIQSFQGDRAMFPKNTSTVIYFNINPHGKFLGGSATIDADDNNTYFAASLTKEDGGQLVIGEHVKKVAVALRNLSDRPRNGGERCTVLIGYDETK